MDHDRGKLPGGSVTLYYLNVKGIAKSLLPLILEYHGPTSSSFAVPSRSNCQRLGGRHEIKDFDHKTSEGILMTLHDSAYTSPIWNTPSSKAENRKTRD